MIQNEMIYKNKQMISYETLYEIVTKEIKQFEKLYHLSTMDFLNNFNQINYIDKDEWFSDCLILAICMNQ